MGWTKDQEQAIYTDTGSGNLLVSAAAGSGKTAVLVERILQKILSGKSTVDRLLVVTFTEAAASEMRQKIIKRLSEYLKNPENDEKKKKLIKDELRLAQTADIMTIDGFCSKVVLNNFHTLGIDPNIQVCDEAMSGLLAKEAMDLLFSRIYKSDDADMKARFKRLTDFYAKDRNNDGLANIILSVYRFTESFADPEQWMDTAVADFDLPFSERAIAKFHEQKTRSVAGEALQTLNAMPQSDNEEFNVCKKKISDVAKAIVNAKSWDDIHKIYAEYFNKPKDRKLFRAIPAGLPETADTDTLTCVTEDLTDIFDKISDRDASLGITFTEAEFEKGNEHELVKEEAEDLQWIVCEFIKEFSELKAKRNLYQFSDIERLTYRLFRDNENIRNEYRDKYDEILIDEYQDTNMLQDTIFELISHKNIFMVGDLKQSIYRFRKGDPYIFKGKSATYRSDDTQDRQITLSQNFRSRKEILNSVNDIFEKIMSETAGDVNYTGDELIVRDDEYEYYPPPVADMKSELHYLSVDTDCDTDYIVSEARYTAKKIRELLDSNTQVYDKSTGVMRPIQKRDIVILENSFKYNAEIITDELSKLGIASYIDKASFFERREISTMLALIRVINNAHNDIPLISVMRSPIGGFSDNDLALIRLNHSSANYFIDAVTAYEDNGADDKLAAQCRKFIYNLHRWRNYIRKKSVAQLIWSIYEETCFYDIMGAIEEGDEAQTNLRLLYERAKQYELAGFKGLFNFISYIELLEGSDSDKDGAKIIGENHDVVRIMTIHKSKGLEFPYVFLLGAGRNFPFKTDRSPIRIHKILGFGLPCIYYDKHYAQKTHAFDLINTVNKIENYSESMRLLYVALTRPREKLYVIVSQSNQKNLSRDAIETSWSDALTGNKMRPSTALLAKCFGDWLCPAAYASPDTWKIVFKEIRSMPEPAQAETETPETYEDSCELRKSVYSILDYKYPYQESDTVPSRTSVTQLKELAQSQADDTEYEPDSRRTSGSEDIAELMFSPLHSKPKFLLDDSEKPANEIGTLYHLMMSKLDITAIAENGAGYAICELNRLVAEEVISEDDMVYIDADKIVAFFETDLAVRMAKSRNVNREKPFQINISALEYDPSLPDICKDEKVILQGIIDCFFEENDGFVLFDYKTDKVKNNSAEIKKRYQKQLELYKQAIEELTGKPVKETYLYLFDTNEVI